MRRTYKKLKFKFNQLFLIIIFFVILILPVFGDVIFTDALGHSVRLHQYPPQRIISLAPNITEILYALGLEKQIIGVTDFCLYPSAAAKKPKIGGFINPNLEIIISLSPDLVIMTADSNQEKIYHQLNQLNIPVYVIYPDTIQSIFTTIRQLAILCGVENSADNLLLSLQYRLELIQKKTASVNQPKILFLWSTDPLITAGKNTFTDDMIRLIGGINIAGDSNIKYPKFSKEEIILRNPDIIIIASMDPNQDKDVLLRQWARFTNISAIQNKRIYFIPAELLSRPAPSLWDGLALLAEIVYPDKFEENNATK